MQKDVDIKDVLIKEIIDEYEHSKKVLKTPESKDVLIRITMRRLKEAIFDHENIKIEWL